MRRGTRRHLQGFTVIEVLVAVVLLSVIVLVVLTPLTGFFGLTRRSGEQVSASQTAQRTLELVRGDWLDVTRYDQACLAQPLPITAADVRVEVTDLDHEGRAVGASPFKESCDGEPTPVPDPPVPLKRIRVTVQTGETKSVLSLDVARP